MAQANQSGLAHNAPPPESVPQQQVSTIPSPSVAMASAPSPLTAITLVPTTQQVTKPGPIPTEGRAIHPASGQTSSPYTAQLQYYAEQATKSLLSTPQVASISTTPPANIATTQTTVAIPERDVPQAQANVRTPRDANKSTLARDILRSLRIAPKPHQETGGTPTETGNNREGDQLLPEVTRSQPASRVASPKPPAVSLLATGFVNSGSPSIHFAKPNAQDEPERVASPSPSRAKLVGEEAHGQAAVIEGPIMCMIDLTLEDSGESVDGSGQDPTFLMQTAASAATSSRPVSLTNTTNHTPLLKKLSLEEPPVAADVHMYSPPLSLATEENMDPKHLCLPPGSAELVSSIEQLPREADEHPLDSQLPLFLPSPPVSPVPTEPPETDLDMINDEGESRPSLKRRSVDVDVMGIGTGLVTPPRVRKRRKQQVYVLIPPAPLYVKKAIKKMKKHAIGEGIDSDLEWVGEDEECMAASLAFADL